MRRIWHRIERWFKGHAHNKAFSIGATESEMLGVENILNLDFPEDLRESYKIHNGIEKDASFFGNRYLMCLRSIVAFWILWRDSLEKGELAGWKVKPKGPIKPVRWSLGWIPIMDDSVGDYVCVDMDPAEGGQIGQVFQLWKAEGPDQVLANSFREWLSKYAEELEAGQYGVNEGGDILRVEILEREKYGM